MPVKLQSRLLICTGHPWLYWEAPLALLILPSYRYLLNNYCLLDPILGGREGVSQSSTTQKTASGRCFSKHLFSKAVKLFPSAKFCNSLASRSFSILCQRCVSSFPQTLYFKMSEQLQNEDIFFSSTTMGENFQEVLLRF